MAHVPRIAARLNHVAYATFDTEATTRFYTEVMGFALVSAIRGRAPDDPSRSYLHTFFAMESGEVIAFFELEGLEPPPRDRLPRWIRHLALEVDSEQTLLAWKERLEHHGLEVTGPVDHEGVWLSIYFGDPNGVTLELTHQRRALTADDARRAVDLVAAWRTERRATARLARER